VYRMFLNYYLLKVFFRVKILLFVTLKSDQDPDPHGSALVWLPDQAFESGSAMKPMLIHSAVFFHYQFQVGIDQN
jgi:hypothetical protein